MFDWTRARAERLVETACRITLFCLLGLSLGVRR